MSECLNCGKPVKRQATCGRECRRAITLKKRLHNCEHCGSEFERKAASVRFCSKACTYAGRAKSNKRPKYAIGVCSECGKEVERPAWKVKAGHKFACSAECQGKRLCDARELGRRKSLRVRQRKVLLKRLKICPRCREVGDWGSVSAMCSECFRWNNILKLSLIHISEPTRPY